VKDDLSMLLSEIYQYFPPAFMSLAVKKYH